ncbi:MAG: CGGC domain-containing protein [Candidatus Desulfofervidus auxilii]|nr:CGGC domain-containing protein [Candidatus Desulfofervidus auxilii]
MKKIALLACYLIRKRNLCPGDAKCLIALNRKEGEFERYKGEEAAIVGIVDCGECEGNRNRAVLSFSLLKMQLAALNETVDAIHVGTCIMNFCPRKDHILEAIKEKAGVEVIEGTHKYMPPTIF